MELVDKVYEIIEKAMCAYYTGDFTLTIDGNQWKLSLDLNQWKAPLVLVYEGDEEGFFEFLEKELRNRQLDRTKYYSGEMTTPGEGNQYIVLAHGDREWSKED